MVLFNLAVSSRERDRKLMCGQWHGVAAAIRDAQELGFHRDNLDPKPKDSSIESILENQWLVQRRRKMYMYLVTWYVAQSIIQRTHLRSTANLCKSTGTQTWPSFSAVQAA